MTDLEWQCKCADGQALVAEDLGWHLACAWAMAVALGLELSGYVGSPWSWLAGIAFGFFGYRLAVRKYQRASDAAWAAMRENG